MEDREALDLLQLLRDYTVEYQVADMTISDVAKDLQDTMDLRSSTYSRARLLTKEILSVVNDATV